MANNRRPTKKQQRQIAANASSSRGSYTGQYTAIPYFGDTLRDDAAQYGYPKALDFQTLYSSYSRGGLFKAIVDIIPERAFVQYPQIVDGDENDSVKDNPTQFEQELKKLNDKFNLVKLFKESEKYKNVGRYSAIVPVYKESAQRKLTDEPSKAAAGQYSESVIDFRLYYEAECEASSEAVEDYFDPDYNKPKYYTIKNSALSDRSTNNATQTDINRKRVFINTSAVGGTIYGDPILEAPFNALFDAVKVRGASSEGYRKNAMQKTVINVTDPVAAKMFADPTKKAELDNNIDEFTNNFNKVLKVGGMDVSTLQATIEDPTGAFNICLQEVAASIRVPVTELIGFMTGERSSGENARNFNKRLTGEQENEIGPRFRKFIQFLIDLNILPKPSRGEFSIIWPDVSEPTAAEKLDMSEKMIAMNEKAFKARQEPPFTTEEVREVSDYQPNKPETEYEIEDDKQDLVIDEDPENQSADQE